MGWLQETTVQVRCATAGIQPARAQKMELRVGISLTLSREALAGLSAGGREGCKAASSPAIFEVIARDDLYDAVLVSPVAASRFIHKGPTQIGAIFFSIPDHIAKISSQASQQPPPCGRQHSQAVNQALKFTALKSSPNHLL
jgi:hypothetical protein